MRYWELTEHEHDPLTSAKRVCSAVKAFAADKPINIELKPEIVYGNCHGIVLTDLFAEQPGSGVGSLVMRRLLDLADEADLNVYTDAEGPRSTEFYLKLGFEKTKRPHRHQLVHYPSLPLDENAGRRIDLLTALQTWSNECEQ